MADVVDLTCEHECNPMGLSTAKPRFGWRVETQTDGWRQERYQIVVTEDGSQASPVWESGWVESGDSQLIEYDGVSLSPRTRYNFKVRLGDHEGQESNWSKSGWFETSRLDEPWTAPFVGVANVAEPWVPIHLRTELVLPSAPTKARAYVTALGIYELYINGQKVGDAHFTPGWTAYDSRLAYQTYDVTELLRSGVNGVGAIVGAGWHAGQLGWKGARALYGLSLALSLELDVYDEAGTRSSIQTDPGSWKWSRGPIQYSELYHGELYDARSELTGWAEPGYAANGWQITQHVPTDPELIVPQDGPFVREQGRIKPARLFRTPKGETVLDFGQILTGWVRLKVSGTAGDRVTLSHAEVLDADGNFYTENLRTARSKVDYILKGDGKELFSPRFTFQGFRYVRVDAFPGSVIPEDFEAVVLHSDLEQTLEFSCSHEKLNQLHNNILWGWRGNALDVPTDCPQRDERLGWTGDAQVFAGTATYLTRAVTFFRKWLRDLAADQLDDGGVPWVVPDVLSKVAPEPMLELSEPHSATGWGDAAVVIPWILYRRYGDKRLLREHYPSMKAWVEYIRNQATDGLYWNTGFHFGDWLALDAFEGSYFGATPNDLTATAYYAHSADLLSQAAEALAYDEDASTYKTLRNQIAERFQREFFTPSGRPAVRTQTAIILALVFELIPTEQRSRTAQELLSLIEENGGHLVTGFLGTPLICRALSDNGYTDAAYSLVLREEYPSWLYQVNQGATTVWEHWDGLRPDGSMWSADMNSFNHYAYGAVGSWLYSVIGGIDLDRSLLDAREFVIAPRPGGGIDWCRCVYNSVYGPVSVLWSLHKGVLEVDVSVPPNTTALLDMGPIVGSEGAETLRAGTHTRSFRIGNSR